MTLRDDAERSLASSFLVHAGVMILMLIVVFVVTNGLEVSTFVAAVIGGVVYGAVMALSRVRKASTRRR